MTGSSRDYSRGYYYIIDIITEVHEPVLANIEVHSNTNNIQL